MKKNKTLTNLRIDSNLFEEMLRALEKMNDSSDIEFTMGDFRRLAYRFFASHIQHHGVAFNVSVNK